MSEQVIRFMQSERRVCDGCGAQGARMSIETERFNYKTENDNVVELSAKVPVWTCPDCGAQYTDGTAEDIRHAAVCRYLGRLTPAEIKELREHLGLSQSEFSDLTGIGIASVKRWESSALIQSLAFDRYLRLLGDERNIFALRTLDEGIREPIVPRFHTGFSTSTIKEAAIFQLRVRRSA